jgi:hypothetical protein
MIAILPKNSKLIILTLIIVVINVVFFQNFIQLEPQNLNNSQVLSNASSRTINFYVDADNSLDLNTVRLVVFGRSLPTENYQRIETKIPLGINKAVTFFGAQNSDALQEDSILGIFVPDSYSVEYTRSIMFSGMCQSPDFPLQNRFWTTYIGEMPDPTVPIIYFKKNISIPYASCLNFFWKIKRKAHAQELSGIVENLTITTTPYPIGGLPETHFIERKHSNPNTPLYVRIGANQDYAALIKDFRIGYSAEDSLQIMYKGAPTDAGMHATAHITNVSNVYDNPNLLVAHAAFNQGSGHPYRPIYNIGFTQVDWAFKMPLRKPGPYTLFGASNCGDTKDANCWMPLYSDFSITSLTSLPKNTAPILANRGIRLFDGRVEMYKLFETSNTIDFKINYQYRVAKNFNLNTDGYVEPYLWMNQVLPQGDNAVYFYYTNGSVQSIKSSSLESKDPENLWQQLACENKNKRCSIEPIVKYFSCNCNQGNNLQKIVFEYELPSKRKIAMSLGPSPGESWNGINFSISKKFGQLILLMRVRSMSFNKPTWTTGAQFNRTYNFHIGDPQDLKQNSK